MDNFDSQNNQKQRSPFINDQDLTDKKLNPIPTPEKSIGMDTSNQFYTNIMDAVDESKVDISKIESFTQASQNRETLFEILDTMGEDTTIAAVLETYAEDATEVSENGRIIWCQSDDENVSKYITFLLDSLNIDKNIFKYAYCLIKYGDVYLRLYRDSDIEDGLFDDQEDKGKRNRNFLHEQLGNVDVARFMDTDVAKLEKTEKQDLEESVIINAYKPSDKYVHYVELENNPAEVFELTKFGKTYAYIVADVRATNYKQSDNLQIASWKYSFNRSDVNVYDATTFVHGALEDDFSRFPEKVEIFNSQDNSESKTKALAYTVRKGQSVLYSVYRIWRCLMLLENSLLLNRLTKSSIIRVIGVEVGDMPREDVGRHMMGIKQLMEQKTALDTGNRMTEYTNPGPMENCIYVPTHNGVGALSTQQIGGDVDIKGLGDLDYFKDKMFGGLKVPKQYFSGTDDNTGFNGGTSLSLISSRYAKTVKRIQNTLIQMVTDLINLMLLDKGLSSYINKFDLHMQAPTTQEEVDRRDNMASKVQITQDIMNLVDSIEDPAIKLKILKTLLSDVVDNPDIMSMLEDEITKLEEEPVVQADTQQDDELEILGGAPHTVPGNVDSASKLNVEDNTEAEEPENNGEEMVGRLPTPGELGKDFTDNDQEF